MHVLSCVVEANKNEHDHAQTLNRSSVEKIVKVLNLKKEIATHKSVKVCHFDCYYYFQSLN